MKEEQVHTRSIEGDDYIYKVFWRLYFRLAKQDPDKNIICTYSEDLGMFKRFFWKFYWRTV